MGLLNVVYNKGIDYHVSLHVGFDYSHIFFERRKLDGDNGICCIIQRSNAKICLGT